MLFFILLAGTAVNASAADYSNVPPTEDEIKKEVDKINASIKQKGAKWKAKKTSIAALSPFERSLMVGQIYEPAPVSALPESAVASQPLMSSLPSSVDWRNYGGNFVTGVRNQGSCGSCWAFGSTAALESRKLIDDDIPGTDLDLSEQVAISCSNQGDCSGGYLLRDYFVDTGLPLESCYPYAQSNGTCTKACKNWELSAYKVSRYTTVLPNNSVDVLKNALIKYGPTVTTMEVYSDFDSYGSGIYSYTSGVYRGGHAILLLGYDDTNSCFICKNSWGTGWGEAGFFQIAYSEVDSVVNFGYNVVSYGDEIIYVSSSITSPANGAVVSGATCPVSGTATKRSGFEIQKVQVSCDGGATWSDALDTSGDGSWSTWGYIWTLPSDNSYSLKSKAIDTTGHEESPGSGIEIIVDNVLPASSITSPAAGSTLFGSVYTVLGTTNGDTNDVKVSTDGGANWTLVMDASGDGSFSSWSYDWTLPSDGTYVIKTKATDQAGNIESPGAGTAVTVSNSLLLHGMSAWGYNFAGMLGDTTSTDRNQPVSISGIMRPKAASCGALHSLVLNTDGDVYAMGYNGYGELGIEAIDYTTHSSPVQVHNISDVKAVSAGYYHSVALKNDGTVWAWGYNDYGQIGDNSNDTRTAPVQVGGGMNGLVAVSAGDYHTLALKSDGTVYAWGYNSFGQLGDNSNISKNYPVQVSGLTGVVAIAAGGSHSLALKCDGSVWGWGNNSSGQLGNGTNSTSYVPVQMNGGKVYKAIAAGYIHSVLLRFDGEVRTCGYNYYGQLGNGNNINGNSPALISGGTANVVSIAAGAHHSIIKKSDGSIQAWGKNDHGQLGNAGNTHSNVPVTTLGALSDTVSISAGGDHSAAISMSPDAAAPTLTVITPASNETIKALTYNVTGTADDGAGSGVNRVEVSTDGGSTWNIAEGTNSWSYKWFLPIKGSVTLMFRGVDNADNTGSPMTRTVNIDPVGDPELQHFNWDYSFSVGTCEFCHAVNNEFLPAGFRRNRNFCHTCHNAAGISHESIIGWKYNHSLFVNATATGRKKPSYGNVTSGQTNNMPVTRLEDGYKVSCITCHNAMSKPEDYGRTWEPATPDADHSTYTLEKGEWGLYGYLVPKVYRDTSLWGGGGPAYSKTKKDYLVDPSEYTYKEISGIIRFNSAQSPLDYVYVTLGNPYLRASSQDNRLCADCHTETTHKGFNCLNCHQAHNSGNIMGIRETVRTADLTERAVVFLGYSNANSFADGTGPYDGICEVCHTATLYYRRDGGGAATHADGQNYDSTNCTACHSHSGGFVSP